MRLVLRRAFCTANVVLFLKKLNCAHGFALMSTIGIAGKLKGFHESKAQNKIKNIKGLRFPLYGHALWHFGNEFTERSVLIYLHVC